jgi:hypothetical protein
MQARRAQLALNCQISPKLRLFWRTLLIAIVVAIILGVTLWAVVLPRLVSGAYLGPSASGYTVISQSKIGPGDVISFDVGFANVSGQTITLQSISFPRELPTHVHLVRAVVAAAEELTGWHPISGFRLAPHYHALIRYAVTSDTVGTFPTGPLTVHALAPILFGSDFGALPVSMTYHQYGILCMQDQSACDQAIDTVEKP